MNTSRTRIQIRRRVAMAATIAAVLAIAMTACDGSTKVDATVDVTKQPPATSLEISAAEYSFELNSKVLAAGRVPVTFHNNGSEAHEVLIARLHDGVTLDRYLSAAQSDEGEAESLIDNAGGVNIVDPGGTGVGYADFQPGTYALLCYIPSGDLIGHLHKGMTAELTVPADISTSQVAAPNAIADIVMQDFSFTLPPQGLATPGTYRFVNNGTEAHEFSVMRIADDKTLNDVIPYLQAGFQGDKPLSFVGGSGGVEPGKTGYVDLDLAPGQYVAMCFIVDPASHKHHAELGMFVPFTIDT